MKRCELKLCAHGIRPSAIIGRYEVGEWEVGEWEVGDRRVGALNSQSAFSSQNTNTNGDLRFVLCVGLSVQQ